MNQEQQALWNRLQAYRFDAEGASFPFSVKLAKENGWTREFTRRAIDEYRRFLFLAMHAGHPISPSDAVDQVWHMHMVYTEDYWKRMCGEVLGRPFHHHPSQGGQSESEKFDDWYEKTLMSYQSFFGAKAPTDIWPEPLERRLAKEDFVRVDRARNWVIRRPRISIKPTSLTILGLMTAGCAGANPLDLKGPEFLGFFAATSAVLFGLALYARSRYRTPEIGSTIDDLDPIQVAYLNGGKVLALNTALAGLYDRKLITISGEKPKVTATGSAHGLHPIEQGILDRTQRSQGLEIGRVRDSMAFTIEGVAESLKSRGLIVDDIRAQAAKTSAFAIAMVAPLIGAVKILIGMDRGKPVLFLILMTLVTLIGALVLLFLRPHRTRYGDAVLADYRRRTRSISVSSGGQSADGLMMGVAVFGIAGLAGTPYASLQKSLQPPSGSSSCGGGSSGCGGGGGCGGGCGGCGG